MYELKKNDEINRLIAVMKSDSGISGPDTTMRLFNQI